MEAVPLPWCTSKSITNTLFANFLLSSTLAAIAISFNKQKPSPLLLKAWCVPPALLKATPYFSAN